MSKTQPYKNRIIGEGDEPIDQIQFNPANWRIHPQMQQDALNGVLREVGWVQRVVVNKRTGNLVDGHARVMLADRAGEKTVPVIYVDLSEDEEKLILASLDPIAEQAATDKEKLEELLQDIQSCDPGLQALFADMAERERLAIMGIAGGSEVPDGFKSYDENIDTEHCCPKCGYKWSGKNIKASD